MLPNEQKIYDFQFVIGTCSVFKMLINIIKCLFKRDELETSPLSTGDIETMRSICSRHLRNNKFYEFSPSMSVFPLS